MPSILADVFCILGKLGSRPFSTATGLERYRLCVCLLTSSGNFIKFLKHDFSSQHMCWLFLSVCVSLLLMSFHSALFCYGFQKLIY